MHNGIRTGALVASAMVWIACAVASARARMAFASPAASLAWRAMDASEARTVDCLKPSATLISAWRCPSDSRIEARFLRSAETCRCMSSTTRSGSEISRISQRRQATPQGLAAWLMASDGGICYKRGIKSQRGLSRLCA